MAGNFKTQADFGFKDELVAVARGSKVPMFPDWETYVVGDKDIDRWDMQRNNVGLRTTYYPTFDIDISIPAVASAVETILRDTIGARYVFRGRKDANGRPYVKRAFVYRLDPFAGKFRKMRVSAKTVSGDEIAVELLADGQQVVLAGTHPDGSEYGILSTLRNADELDMVNVMSAETAIERIAEHFERMGCTKIKVNGTSTHQAQVQAAPQIEVTDEQWEQLPSIVAAIPNDDDRHWDDWLKVGFALRTCAGDNEDRQAEAFAIWEEFSARSPKDDPDFTRHKWENDIAVSNRGNVGLGSLIWEARQNGWTDGTATAARDAFDDVDLGSKPPVSQQAKSNLLNSVASVLVYPKDWKGKTAPARVWLVDGWIPAAEVTSFYAPGGSGKSLLAQQLSTCRAIGADWLGLPTKAGRTLVLACEDKLDEIWRRQEDVNSHLMTDMQTVDVGVGYWSRVGNIDNALMTIDPQTNKGTLTDFWKGVKVLTEKEGFDLIIVDTVADTFPDNENDRYKVNLFIKGALAKLAQETGAAILVLAHPSKSSMQGKDLSSGSTAWDGAVRQKLGMRKNEDGVTYALAKNKSNYSSTGDEITLKWEKGVFVVVASSQGGAGNHDQDVDDYLIQGIHTAAGRGLELGASHMSKSRYAPSWVYDNVQPPVEIEDFVDTKMLKSSLQRLLRSGKLITSAGSQISQKLEVTA